MQQGIQLELKSEWQHFGQHHDTTRTLTYTFSGGNDGMLP